MKAKGRIGVIDYGAGNLRSLANALHRLEYEALICTSPRDMEVCQGFVLPGVGSYPSAMETLSSRNLLSPLQEAWQSGVPIMGICLGLQLFYEDSDESGGASGLGWLAGSVRRLSEAPKLPHVGWNTLSRREGPYGGAEHDGSFVYFTHSYAVPYANQSECTSTCRYGTEFVAGIEKDNLLGYQFHPEKSGDVGLALLADFAGKVR